MQVNLEMQGWPSGMDEETAEWLVMMCARVLSEVTRPLNTLEVYEVIKAFSHNVTTVPEKWKRAVDKEEKVR